MSKSRAQKVALTTSILTTFTLTAAGPVFAAPVEASPESGSVVVYWGIDEQGNYFETQPLDGTNPANLGITNADDILPLNEEAEPVVITPEDDITLSGDEAEAYLKSEAETSKTADQTSLHSPATTAAAAALYCERTVTQMKLERGLMKSDAKQTCTGSFTRQWIDASIQREYAWYQVVYSPWRTWTGTISSAKTWNLAQACNIDGTYRQGNYRWNTRGWAQASNGVIVGGNEIWGLPRLLKCGY